MFDIKQYYKKENDKIFKNYENGITTIKAIFEKTKNINDKDEKKQFFRFFNYASEFIIKLYDYSKRLSNDYFASKSFNELLKENNDLYKDMVLENYKTSYANPTYCVEMFGDGIGQLMSVLFTEIINIKDAILNRLFIMEQSNQLFIDIFNYVSQNQVEYNKLKNIIASFKKREQANNLFYLYKEQYDKDFRYYLDIIEESDLKDLRYLFKFGLCITENEIKMAEFLNKYSDDKIHSISNQIVESYKRGFKRDNKDITKKSTVGLNYVVGMERIYRTLIKMLKQNRLSATIVNLKSFKINEQYSNDHKFDDAVYLDDDFVNIRKNDFSKALEMNKEILSQHSGTIHFDNFGSAPFKYENKKECLKLDNAQQQIKQKLNSVLGEVQNKYLSRAEISYGIIAFPEPSIGNQFEQIFDEIVNINMLDNDKYQLIHQKLIHELDKADYVHIKGKNGNQTDLKVKMLEFTNPEKETNFVNSGASVNIPVGEVYTSPKLSGTNGILHVGESFLHFFRYSNLKITFKDGFIESYSCDNFPTEEENKKYIEENLLFPHKTLPMGEFAIGTNTLAFVTARKYNISNILPILIMEKTGPHFAVGDTCFSRREDNKIYNSFTGKEIIAKDNEKSILRKTKPEEAYTYVHIDITMPFESIDFITAITKDGQKIDIIKNGRFVVEGTEELNEALDNYFK